VTRLFILLFRRYFDWKLFFASLVVFGIISSAGWWYYQSQRAKITEKKHDEILAIAEAKEDRIVQWRKERLIDARILLNSPFTRRVITDMVRGTDSPRDRADLAAWLVQARDICEYTDIGIFDTQGKLVLGAGPTIGVPGPFVKAYVEETVQAGELQMTDIYRNERGQIVIEIYRPLYDFSPQPKISGILLLRMDPRIALYPIIQTWPTPSRSYELILFTREGDTALVLNELRYRKGTALNLRRPATDFGLPAGETAQMVEDAFEEVDYRGVPVVAALRHIPDSPWFLLAKEDQEEGYQPLRDFQEFMAVAMGLVFLVTGMVLVAIWFFRRGAEAKKAS